MKDSIKRAQSKLACIAERENFRLKGKKIIMTLAAVLCCAMTMTVLTACGSDDDNDTDRDTTPVEAVMRYNLSSGEEMRNLFDLTIEYYDADGNVQTEKVTEDFWTKEIKTKLPATLGARLKVQLKDGVDANTVGRPWISYGYEFNGTAKNSKGKTVSGNVIKKADKAYRLKENKLSDFLDNYSNGLVNFLFVYDVNGKVTEGEW